MKNFILTVCFHSYFPFTYSTIIPKPTFNVTTDSVTTFPACYIDPLHFTCRYILEGMLQKVAETRIYVVEPSCLMMHLKMSDSILQMAKCSTLLYCKKIGGSEVLKFLAKVSIPKGSEVSILTVLWHMSLTWKRFCPLAFSTRLVIDIIVSCPRKHKALMG